MKLRPHQKVVVDYMKNTNARGIVLYHGLGSGKTITSIAVGELYPNNKIVIVPASMRTQWDKELKKMKVNLNKYSVMSYEGFLKKVESNENFLNSKVVIVDEAHRIRSATGKIAIKAVSSLQNAFKVVLLTGTPMVNSSVDFSQLVNAITGEDTLPVDDKKFKQLFYIQKSKKIPNDDKRCKLYSPVTCSEDGFSSINGYCEYHNYMQLKRSSLKIRKEKKFKPIPNFVKKHKERIERQRASFKEGKLIPNTVEYKKHVKCIVSYYMPQITTDYPSVKRSYIKVKMSPQQNKTYIKATKKIPKADMYMMESGREVTRSGMAFNAFLNLTRQISNITKNEKESPKLKEILKKIKNGPKPAIIYSNWLDYGIRPMADLLNKNNISNFEFTGSLNDSKKKDIVTKYNNGEMDVLLLSSSGGEGLDLKNTRQIHIMEPHWNIAKINQVIGRGIRYKSHEALPQNQRNVHVYYWISVPKLEKNKMGSDEYLYKISSQKTEEMHEFMKTVIKGSIENGCKNIKTKKGGAYRINKKRNSYNSLLL